MHAGQSWAITGLLTGVAAFGWHIVGPFAQERGHPFLWAYWFYGIVMAGELFAALWMLRREGHSFDWPSITSRFRLTGLTRHRLLVSFGALLVMLVGYALVGRLAIPIAEATAPAYLPDLVVPGRIQGVPRSAMGVELPGNYLLVVPLLLQMLVTPIGEELLWRGAMLPRMEKAHGRSAWLLQGFQGAVFHLYLPWEVLTILPGSLLLAWLAQRFKSTTYPLLLHFIFDAVPRVALFLVIFGIV